MNEPSRRFWAVVPAAGRGARFGSSNLQPPKQYAPLAGATVIEWALAALAKEQRVVGIVVPVAADDAHWPIAAASMRERLGSEGAAAIAKVTAIVGGASRQESVLNGLRALEDKAAADDWIVVHDAARPCLSAVDLTALLDAVETGNDHSGLGANGALLAAPVVDTVKRERDGVAVDTVDRNGLWRALTPQVFAFARLRQALEDIERTGVSVTDEAQAMERLGLPAALVRGSPFNIKVTRAEDLSMAETILSGAARPSMRVGQGFDVHAFGAGDHVVLAGVELAHTHGVIAHSDGDVLIHALCDALLGALGQGDIGQHFPDTDPAHKGADSRVFLREVARLVRNAKLKLVNADLTLLAESPRIGKYRSQMAANLAQDLDVLPSCVNIKATTTERLGFIGRGDGLAASATVLLAGS